MEVSDDVQAIYDNARLLRVQLHLTAEEFKIKHRGRYSTSEALERAARRYANEQHRSDAAVLWELERDVIETK